MRPEVSRCFFKISWSTQLHVHKLVRELWFCLRLWYIFQSSWADDRQDWHTAAHYRSGGSNPPCAPRADQWHIPLSGLSHCHQGCGATVQVHTGMWATCAFTYMCTCTCVLNTHAYLPSAVTSFSTYLHMYHCMCGCTHMKIQVG